MKTSEINASEIINKNFGDHVLCTSGRKNYGVLINKESSLVAADNIDISSFADDDVDVELIDSNAAAELYAEQTGQPESDYSSYEYIKITLTSGDNVEQYVLPTTGW